MTDQPEAKQSETSNSITNVSGGVNANAQRDINISGDVVGRDKITSNTIINEAPRVGANLLHQLPAPPADFTGRTAELAELCEKFDKGVTISGLQGQGGVGKTALALSLAAQLVERYPDAQIFLDLKGVSGSPLTAGEITTHIVRSFDLMAKLPEDEAGLAAAYRSALFNKQVLLLLDNARDAEQIKPLLPPPAGCGLIVTSRLHFHVPGLYAQNLETLPKDDARALLIKIAAQIGDEADHVARLCGYLPLTLTMAGSALAERIDLKPATYAHRLENEQTRLDMVASSFALSYELLSEELQTMWPMLAVFPNTFEVEGAAAVCELEREVAEMRLSDLVRYSLVEWDAKLERYHLHDMARLFASSKLTDDRTAAQRRHSKHYKTVLAIADNLYLKGGDAIMQGLVLFDMEQENILAGQAWATKYAASDDDVAQLCSDYCEIGGNCLNLRLSTQRWIEWLDTALAVARRLKNRRSEGSHLGNLGWAYTDLDEPRRAVEFYQLALALVPAISEVSISEAERISTRRGEGQALGNLGSAYYQLGEVSRAIEFYEQALAVAREINDKRQECTWQSNLGTAYAASGEMQKAIESCEQALVSAHVIGDWRVEGSALSNLGVVYATLGDAPKAISLYEKGLVIACKIGDRRREMTDLDNLGLSYATLDNANQAIEFYERALLVSHEIGDGRKEGSRLGNLGLAYKILGDERRAIDFYERALIIARETGDQRIEASVLSNLGVIHATLGQVRQAIQHYEHALAKMQEIGDRRSEATVMNNLKIVNTYSVASQDFSLLNLKASPAMMTVLYVNYGHRTFSEQDRKLYEIFANLASHALKIAEQARKFSEQDRKLFELFANQASRGLKITAKNAGLSLDGRRKGFPVKPATDKKERWQQRKKKSKRGTRKPGR